MTVHLPGYPLQPFGSATHSRSTFDWHTPSAGTQTNITHFFQPQSVAAEHIVTLANLLLRLASMWNGRPQCCVSELLTRFCFQRFESCRHLVKCWLHELSCRHTVKCLRIQPFLSSLNGSKVVMSHSKMSQNSNSIFLSRTWKLSSLSKVSQDSKSLLLLFDLICFVLDRLVIVAKHLKVLTRFFSNRLNCLRNKVCQS